MKPGIFIVIIMILASLSMISCDKNKTSTPHQTTAQALTNYWPAETNLTAALEARDGTMKAITDHINALNSKSGKDALTEIDALVEQYESQSNTIATRFDDLIRLEGNIRPYGADKGILGNICNGVYTAARNKVVSAGKMVRSGWRVLRGSQSLRQVLRDPDSGIPILSDAAQKLAAHNAQRDAAITTAILANNSENGMIPLEELPGATPQEKLNSYLNMDEETSLKMNIRRDVMYWDEEETTRTAKTAVDLGETGVKLVGDAYGGDIGEVTNEILLQHMNEGQNPNDKGTCNLSMNKDADGNPPITANKTIIIAKANMPTDDPRITVIMNAPQNIALQLPTGEYHIIGLAEGFIRTTEENLTMAQGQIRNVMAKLLSMADNAIVIDALTADPETVTIGDVASFHVSCASTLGQDLTFDWAVSGGTVTDEVKSQTDYSFKPTQEADYTITVTIHDGLNNVKTRSVTITAVNADLTIDSYDVGTESYTDTKVNPGETLTMALHITNNGSTDLTGVQRIEGTNGITSTTGQANVTIPAGESVVWNVNVTVPDDYGPTSGALNYFLDTHNQFNLPVTVPVIVEFPVDFYAEIEPIASPVITRVLNVVGHVANPHLATATLIMDNDYEQVYTVNLTNGSFNQAINIAGTAEETTHILKLIGYSGGNEAMITREFSSLVPIMDLKVTLTWDTSGTDVDLWVTDPNGEKCYYAHTTTVSGLSLDFDDTNGYGPESITSSTIIPGDYLVQAEYYSDHDSENAIVSGCQVLIKLNEGSTDETNNTYYGTLNDTGDLWNVTTLHFNGSKWTVKGTSSVSRYQGSLPAK